MSQHCNGSTGRNGNGNGKKPAFIDFFPYARVEKELRKRGLRFVPKNNQVEAPFCGEFGCHWSKRQQNDEICVVRRERPTLRKPRPRGEREPKTTFLVCKRCLDQRKRQPNATVPEPVKMHPNDFLSTVAEAIDCTLVSVRENGHVHFNGHRPAKTPPPTIRRRNRKKPIRDLVGSTR